MAPRLITGPRLALEHSLACEVQARQSRDPLAPIHILVGGTLLRSYLRRILADGLGGVANVHVLTPGELGLLLGEPALVARGDAPLPFLAERVLASQAAANDPGAFEPVAALPGFPGALARTLRDLRFSDVSPAHLTRAAEADEDQDDPDTRRLASLAALHADAQAGRAGRYGPEEALAHADPDLLGGKGLIVYGLWTVSALLQTALVRIADSGQPVTVLTPATATPADGALHDFWRFATDDLRAERHDLPLEAAEAGEPTNLATAQRHLFTTASASHGSDRTLQILSAPDPAREAREVVRRLLAWADEGIAFHEMAVVYRDGGTYRALLEAALRDADVPAYVHEGTPLTERPLGRRITALLALADARNPDTDAPRLDRADVVAFLADARLPEETFADYGRSSVPRWEQMSRQAGVTGGSVADWQQRLDAYAEDLAARAKPDEEIPAWLTERQDSARRLAAFVTDLDVALTARPAGGPWTRHVAWLDDLLARYVGDSTPVRGALGDLARLDDLTGPIDASGFSSAVTAVLEGLRDRDVLGSRQGAFGLRGVAVLDANSTRGLGFRAVAVVGVSERAFPPPPREDPLLLDDRRAALNAVHGFRLPLRARGADPEPLEFHSVLAAASERLLASYARAGSDGSAQLPSMFLRAVAEQLSGGRVTIADIDDGKVPGLIRLAAGRIGPADPDSAVTARERRRALLEDGDFGAVTLVRHRLPRTALGARARDARRITHLTAYDGLLSPAALADARTLARFDRLSPTGLESYAGCPHRQLLNGVLGLREIEEPEELLRLSALDKGSAVHEILEHFLRKQPAGRLDLRAEKSRLRSVMAPVLDALQASGRTGYPLLWAVDRTRIEEDLERWLQLSIDELSARPASRGYEVSFGAVSRGTDPEAVDPMSRPEPLTITLSGDRELEIRGFVDRVDHDPRSGSFEVVDYKSGSMWGKQSNALRGGRSLQLPLYVLAIAQALGVDPAQGSARYESVDRKGEFKHAVYDATLLTGDPSPLVGILDELIAAREAGDFHREPSECRFCSVKGACEPRRNLLHTVKSGDPRIVAHAERAELYP